MVLLAVELNVPAEDVLRSQKPLGLLLIHFRRVDGTARLTILGLDLTVKSTNTVTRCWKCKHSPSYGHDIDLVMLGAIDTYLNFLGGIVAWILMRFQISESDFFWMDSQCCH
jgi:hypothetical protein